jgi:hypothetical protein
VKNSLPGRAKSCIYFHLDHFGQYRLQFYIPKKVEVVFSVIKEDKAQIPRKKEEK